MATMNAIADSPPREFQIFQWGPNESDNGIVYCAREDAEAILTRRGMRDVMIDLEHLSLSNGPDRDLDAYGWGKLEVRDDGLWLADIKWTEEGADRLRTKRQRYVSPAFVVDKDDRVVSLTNVALTALPAMRNLPALIAASITRERKDSMDLDSMMSDLAAKATAGEVSAALEVYAALGEALQGMLPEEASDASDALDEATGSAEEAAVAAEEAKDPDMVALEEMASKMGYRLEAMDAEPKEEEKEESTDGEEAPAEEEELRKDSLAALRAEVKALRKRVEARDRARFARPAAKRKDSVSVTDEDKRTAKMLGLPLEKVVMYRTKFGGKS